MRSIIPKCSAFVVGLVGLVGLVGIAGGLVLFNMQSAHAYDEKPKPDVWVKVSPVSKKIALTPGTTRTDEFTVENIGAKDFTFKVYASPYNVVGEQYDLNFTDETPRTQIARWIKFDQTEYDLAVGEKQVVKFSIEVPDDVPDGGQYATIFAESGGKKDEVSTSGIRTVSRIGLIIYGRIGGDTRDGGELMDFRTPGFYFSGPVTATSKVRNDGNTDFEANYSFEIKPLFGSEPVYTKNAVHLVLPDTERRVDLAWDKTPLLGIFTVTHSVTAPGIDEATSRLLFIIPPFVIAIMLLLLTLLIIWIIIKVKKHKALGPRLHID